MIEPKRSEIEEVKWSLDDLIGNDADFRERVEQAERRIAWHRRWDKTVAIAASILLAVAMVLTCWLIATGGLRLSALMP